MKLTRSPAWVSGRARGNRRLPAHTDEIDEKKLTGAEPAIWGHHMSAT